jgi:hypothetical protein
MRVKRGQKSEPKPEIPPETVWSALRALEAKGMIYYKGGGIYVPSEAGWKLLREISPSVEEIRAFGHPNIEASHKSTFEITKAAEITRDADCIIGVRANKGCRELKKTFVEGLKDGKRVEITIEAGGIKDRVIAYGSPALKLTHPEDIVIRKSDFIDNRTLAILADKSAFNLKRELVKKLKNPHAEIKITLEIRF